jgi:signal transduction histidine kinase
MKIADKLVIFSILIVVIVIGFSLTIYSLIRQSIDENNKNSFANEVSKSQSELSFFMLEYIKTGDASPLKEYKQKFSNHRLFLINNPLNTPQERALFSKIFALNNQIGQIFFEIDLLESTGEENLDFLFQIEELNNEIFQLSFQLSELIRFNFNKNLSRYLVISQIFSYSALLLILIYSILLFKSISTPFTELKRVISDLKNKKFSSKVNFERNDEFREIGESFNSTLAALSKMEEEHDQIDKVKTEFLSITSHELRSPMTPMQAQLQMLLTGYYGALNFKQSESIEIVYRNARRLDNIIQDFLEISRIEAARLKFNFIKTSLEPHILNLVKEMKGFMANKNIKIETEISNLPVMEVDPDRIIQVLRNLVNNAIKFSPSNSTITISASLNDQMVEIKVQDQGVGIAQEDQNKIFEPFFQAEQSIYSHKGGTGLGLAIAKGIIESQKGNISLKSALKKGTTFTFTVPLKPVKDIAPIKLLFSPQTETSSKIKALLIKFLGPMGQAEYNSFSNKGINQNNFLLHLEELRKSKIIGNELHSIIINEADAIFGIEGSQSKILVDFEKIIDKIIKRSYSIYGSIAISKANNITGLKVDKSGQIIEIDAKNIKKILSDIIDSYGPWIGDLQKFIRERRMYDKLHKDIGKDEMDIRLSNMLK